MNLPDVQAYTIQNTNGVTLSILNYGAIIQKLMVPDKHERMVNVVIGYANPSDYFHNPHYLGACIGSFAGRIRNGKFKIEDTEYELHQENGVHLHGGLKGLDQYFWNMEKIEQGKDPFIRLSCVSKHLDEGYPGNVKIEVTYQLTENNTLTITHQAITDQTTHINLTNHSYFNLGDMGSINPQQLKVHASKYLEVDDQLLPSGNILPVKGTEFDFKKGKALEELRLDDTFIFDNLKKEVISLYAKTTGIEMKVTTNQPACVIYRPTAFDGICFETQNYPDAPNQDHFPSSLLLPGETYLNKTSFAFSIIN